MARDLGIPSSRLQWIVSAYSLAFGCFLLLWGRIADIFGKRFIFAAGTAWVAAVTAANPFLKNEIAFDLFRGLHGLVSLLPVRRRGVCGGADDGRVLPRMCRLRLGFWARHSPPERRRTTPLAHTV